MVLAVGRVSITEWLVTMLEFVLVTPYTVLPPYSTVLLAFSSVIHVMVALEELIDVLLMLLIVGGLTAITVMLFAQEAPPALALAL